MTSKFKDKTWMRSVSDDTVIPPLYRFVLVRLCLHRNSETGRCDPSHDTVANEIGVSRDTVLRAVGWGARRGWLIKKRGQYGISYAFTFPADKQTSDVAGQQHLDPHPKNRPDVAIQQHLRTKTAANTTANPDVAVPTARCSWPATQMGEERKEGGIAPAPADAGGAVQGVGVASSMDQAFAAFRAVYPRMQGERGALREFIKAVSDGADPDHIIARAKVFALECIDQDPHLIMQPTNWLRNGHYDDPLPTGAIIDNDTGEVSVQTNKPQANRGRRELDIEAAKAEWRARHGTTQH